MNTPRRRASAGLRVIIAGAGGAAHLPGMLAAKTLVPVLGVPVAATQLNGMDSLLSIVQMPKGVPVGTLAIGKPGAANAALLAAEMLATTDAALYERLAAWRAARTQEVLEQSLDRSCRVELRFDSNRRQDSVVSRADCWRFWAAGNWAA